MTFFLISDNIDTYTGLRFAGVDGVVVHEKNEVAAELEKVLSDNNIGIVLITEKLIRLCPELIYDIKLKRSKPLIVEIPDRHGNGRAKDAISSYIRDAIGIKI